MIDVVCMEFPMKFNLVACLKVRWKLTRARNYDVRNFCNWVL